MVRADRGSLSVRGRRHPMGLPDVRHGDRQRDAGFIFGRRSRGANHGDGARRGAVRRRSRHARRGRRIDAAGASARRGARRSCARRPGDRGAARAFSGHADLGGHVQARGGARGARRGSRHRQLGLGSTRTRCWTSPRSSACRSWRCTTKPAPHTKVDVVDAVLRYLDDALAEPSHAVSRASGSSWIPASDSVRPPTRISRYLRGLDRLVALGFPTMLGASRKSTIGKLTGREPADRVYGTVAATALAVRAGDRYRTRARRRRGARRGRRCGCGRPRLEADRMDRIRLDGIRAYGKHGADAAEREHAQPFDVAISAELDLRDASASDDLRRTMDYAALHARIVRIVASRRIRCSSVSPPICSQRSSRIGGWRAPRSRSPSRASSTARRLPSR